MSHSRRLATVAVFAIAMAFVEAAVVVYLRALYYPDGFDLSAAGGSFFFYRGQPPGLLRTFVPLHLQVEVAREAATIVMLATVAILAGDHAVRRFGAFLFAFGLWDIFYYVFLRATLGWPASLGTVDLLFLIPVPWIAPVWVPMIISAGFVLGGAALARGRSSRRGTSRA